MNGLGSDADRISDALNFISPDDRETWVRMGMSIKSELGETGFALWDSWSQGSKSYNAHDARDVWKSIKANGEVTVGTLFHEAKANGWCDAGTRSKPTPEELAERRRQTEAKAAGDRAEIEREREDCARKAVAIWAGATKAPAGQPYLAGKGVAPVDTLREIEADAATAILGYAPRSSGEQLTGRLLVVPVKTGDRLSTVELIDSGGRKTALKGRGTKAGGYWATQKLPDDDLSGLTLLIGEGVATALSGREATEYPAVAALSSGNLLTVSRTMRDRYSDARLIILADLLKATGKPDPHAVTAATAVDGFLAVPDFGAERPEGATDFNDLQSLRGIDEVKAQLESAAVHTCDGGAGGDGEVDNFVGPLRVCPTCDDGDDGTAEAPCSLPASRTDAGAALHHKEGTKSEQSNDRHNHHQRHADEPEDDKDTDALPAGTTLPDEDLAAARTVIDAACAAVKMDHGVLGGEKFLKAVSLIRKCSPEEWARVRAHVKTAARTAGIKLADIERATRPDDGGNPGEGSVTDALVALVRDRAELFHAPDGTCYACAAGEGPSRTYRLDSRAFEHWVSYLYYKETTSAARPGRSASETSIRNARNVLTGIATHDGDEHPVYLRVARHGDAYYLDLGTDDWSAVEITSSRWQIVARPPVRFWRPASLRPMPLPTPDGDLALLWEYANIPDAERPLVLAYLLDAMRPETPFVILELIGQQGSAKSSTQAKLRRCIDPNTVELRAAPKSIEDLFVSAGANWVVSLNNLSHLSPPLQDALCSLATGGGFAGRTLYTNADETLIEAKRPVIINGVVPLVTAQDLTDRVIRVDLPELATFRRETELDAKFEADAPAILGGLLDLFAATLTILPEVKLDRPPRMVDYATLGEAMQRACGLQEREFLRRYMANRSESIARSLEASPVAGAIIQLVEAHRGESPTVWSGTVGLLRIELEKYRDGTEAWPRSDKGLSDVLRRQGTALMEIGISVEFGEKGRTGRGVTISRRTRGDSDPPFAAQLGRTPHPEKVPDPQGDWGEDRV